jgi:hypothetical protein
MRRRLRSQDGVALTVAIFTMAVIALFSALVASSAVHVGDTSNADRDSKRALGAAEAGINTALHRLNSQTSAIDNLGCLTDIQLGVLAQATDYVVAGATVTAHAGQCPGAQGRSGNGGEWIYFITLLNNGQHCDEQYTTQTQVNDLLAVSIGGISVLRRCVTSIGIVNGVQRRLQREIYSEFRLFYGLTGVDSVTANNAILGASHVGSNRLVSMNTATTFNGQVELQTGATNDIHATGQWGVTYRDDPWILDPIKESSVSGTVNPTPTCVGPLLDLLCLNANAGYKSASKRLLVPSGYTVTLPGGSYYLCELSLTGGTLVVSAAAKIYIGRTGTCANTNGLTISRGLINVTGLALTQNLQIYTVEGETRNITIGGNSLTQANLSLYAPDLRVTIGGGSSAPVVKGSISAQEILVQGGASFVADPLLDITAPFAQILGKWHPGKWSECPAKPTETGDPHSGCNG